MKMHPATSVLARAAFLAVASMCSTAGAVDPTWVYDADSNQYPNEAGQPLEGGYVAGGNATRSLVNLGGSDYALEFNTADLGGNLSSYFGSTGPSARWNVSSATGYSVEWKSRLDPVAITTPSANVMVAGNPTDWGLTRIHNAYINPFNNQHYLTVEVQSLDGNSGGVTHSLGNPTDWHTYRMDTRGGVTRLYVDNYFTPVASKTLTGGGSHDFYFGDGTGDNNGKYQIDYIKTWQSGVVGAPQRPDPSTMQRTLLHSSFDGNTGNNGIDPDFARGSNVAIGNGAVINPAGKFGGAMDSYTASGTVNYPVENNFNADSGTVEMWVKTSSWSNGEYAGFFDVYKAGQVDIRLQKTNSDRLQAYAADIVGGSNWSITSAPVSLDGDWHHIAWTWDKNVNMTYLYLDGTPIADLSNVSIAFLTGVDFLGSLTDSTIEVGSIQGGSGAFQGLIDEFRISNYDLYQGGTFIPQGSPFELQKWAVDSDGTWSTASNWTGGVPDYIGATANFLNNNTTTRTIDVDGLRTVGILKFNSPNSYVIGGDGTLILDVGSFSATIDVQQGNHAINTPILLAKNLTANVAAGARIDLTNDVSTPGDVTLTKTGAGILGMKNLRMNAVDVSAGTLHVSAKSSHNAPEGVSVVNGVSAAGKLDLTNNAMVVEYSESSALSAVRSLVQTGYASGSWNGNGITSSAAAAQAATSVKTSLIVLEATERFSSFPGDFYGQNVDDTAVLIQYGLSADATLDGKVNTLDFNMLAGSFGANGGWTQGDFNYDGVVGSSDFAILVGNYGNVMPAASATLGALVPEPSFLSLAAIAFAGLSRRRRD